MKKSKKKRLKDRAWKLFSEWIRRKYSDENGIGECITCGEKLHWKKLQAGHAIAGRTNAMLFDERIVFPQCATCNIWHYGRLDEYTLKMIEKYGKKKYEKIRKEIKNGRVTYTEKDYETKVEQLKYKLKELEGGT